MEKVVAVKDKYALTTTELDEINAYLEDGWTVKSITVITPHETSSFSVLFVLEKHTPEDA